MAGDNIYNGAADNGTGVAMLLEMAGRGLISTGGWALRCRTRSSAAVTTEEQGLLCSEYLGQHPPIPASQIARDIKYDMLLPIGVQQEVNVNGAQRTTFFPEVEATAKRFGLAITPDPRTDAGSYYRSDHFSLSRVGIPAFSIDAGTLYKGHDHAWGIAHEKDFNEHHYQLLRQLRSQLGLPGRRQSRAIGHGSRLAGNSLPHTVEWRAGDEFEVARKRSEGR